MFYTTSLPQIEISLQDEYLFHQAMSTCAADIMEQKKAKIINQYNFEHLFFQGNAVKRGALYVKLFLRNSSKFQTDKLRPFLELACSQGSAERVTVFCGVFMYHVSTKLSMQPMEHESNLRRHFHMISQSAQVTSLLSNLPIEFLCALLMIWKQDDNNYCQIILLLSI